MITDSEFESIIREFAEGQSLVEILKKRGIAMFDFTVFKSESPERLNLFEQAKLAKADVFVEELIPISDTEDNPLKARIRIEARKWYSSKAAPQQYGDRIDINLNQVVDISGALAAANARVVNQIPQSVSIPDTKTESVCPPRDLDLSTTDESLDLSSTSTHQVNGSQPVQALETRDAEEIEDDDIFG